MYKQIIRSYSTPPKVPRFAVTLKEAAKPAIKSSLSITKPFGLDSPVLVNSSDPHQYDLSTIKYQVFSKEAREKRQKVLDHDIAHSPFYESKSFSNVQGKIFTPPISFFKRDKSKYFPDFIGNTLVEKDQRLSSLLKGKVSIVRIFSTISGDQVSQTYFDGPSQPDGKGKLSSNYLVGDGFKEFERLYPESQIIDLNMPQTAVKRFFVNMSKGNLRKLTPKERLNNYFILPFKTFPLQVRQALNCDNVCSGYIYLLDHAGRIRWATSGSANDAERSLMWKCVAGLERELKSLKGTEQ